MTPPLPLGEGRAEALPTAAPVGSTSLGMATEPWPSGAQARTDWLGVVVALSGWAMFFAALAFGVGYLRMREPWPLAGMPPLPRILPAVSLLLLALSGALLHAGGRRPRVAPWLAGALAAAAAALLVQGLVLGGLWSAGLRLPQGGAYASAVYGLGGLHGAHVAVGLVGLAREWVRSARGAQVHGAVRLWALYGHFLAVTGWLLFAAVYLP